MAGYKAHMAFGILTGLVWSLLAFILSFISIWIIPLIFIVTLISSFLPDLDSDTGIPLKILLTILSIIGIIVTGWIIYNQPETSILELCGIPIFIGLFIYYGIGGIFKKLTHHRGIFHSIPAALLFTLISFTLLNQYELTETIKISLSLSVGFGYLSHLILDEINSAVNLGGIPFVPNKSIGTALKFYSKNWKITLVVYIANVWLIYKNWDSIKYLH